MSPVFTQTDGPASFVIYGFILAFVLVYIISFWIVSRRELKANTIFDISFITLFIAVFSARLLGMLLNLQSYLDEGFSLLPLSETANGLRLFAQLPWSVLRFTDGNFSYIGIFLGLVLGLLFIYQNSNQKKTVYVLFDRLVISYCIASLFLLFGLFAHGFAAGVQTDGPLKLIYPDGTMRYPLQLVQIAVTLVFLLVSWLLSSAGAIKPGMISSLFFLIFGVTEYATRPLTAGYFADVYGLLDYHQLIALLMAAVGIILAIAQLLGARPRRRQEAPAYGHGSIRPLDRDREERARERARLYEKQLEESEGRSSGNTNRFVVSFADRLRQDDKTPQE